MARSTTSAAKLFCLRIELQGVTPLIWRRVWVEGPMTLIKLHHIIQAAMGWTDAHLHEFHIDRAVYATPDPDEPDQRDVVDERRVFLQELLQQGKQFEYVYDYGDDWHHLITVERSKPLPENAGGYGYVEAGERACPPEDSGGCDGYQDSIDQLERDPGSDESRAFLTWAGEDFDPGRFDRHAANAALLRMAWNQWGDV